MSFLRDLRVAVHSLARTPGLAITVILTLSLGIGANAAIFTLVRGVLLKPLVNRDENRLIYIRQSAPGIHEVNAAFSVPEIQDLRAGVKTLSALGDFSTMGFTMVGLGEPRSIQGGVVSGTFFDVMGLHPVLGRLIGPQDDGPNAAGVVVLTYRFWATALGKDPSVIGKTVRLGSIGERSAKIIGVLEPCVPYPQDTEIISNIVTSPRTREFGIRLALGSEPRRILKGVIGEGAVMAALGVLAGAAFGFVAARLAGSYFAEMKMPGALPVVISAFLLMTVAVVASLLPAARAARVDVMEALRSE
jgi:hypothetical protein